ncbi:MULTISPECIES: rRNA adenine methyltransferase [unclassified Imperialibacter]|uniref:rRNA adenine methyltransferase n=1 Tax=unclassified Imperialibacter TaxID=2629706 RepID=UPI00125B911B
MTFDPTNEIVQLCAEGMNLEGQGNGNQAAQLFMCAWHLAKNDYEKFIAAHYVARQQPSVTAKLEWNLAALDAASKVSGDEVKGAYPSLYPAIPQKYPQPPNPDVEVRNIDIQRNV